MCDDGRPLRATEDGGRRTFEIDADAPADRTSAFLAGDRIAAAHQLYWLDRAPERCGSTLVYRDDEPVAALVLASTSLFDAVFVEGEPDGIAAAIPRVRVPTTPFWVSGPAEAVRALTPRLRIVNPTRLLRLVWRPARLRVEAPPPVRLATTDYEALAALYRSVPGLNFGPQLFVDGVYYARYAGTRVVAAAGTHGLSPHHRLAIVGNVLTHPAHRRRGHASACVAALVADLVRDYADIVLNVAAANDTALRLYQRLGFRQHCTLVEGQATLTR